MIWKPLLSRCLGRCCVSSLVEKTCGVSQLIHSGEGDNETAGIFHTFLSSFDTHFQADELRGTNSNHISQVQNDIRQLKTAPKGGATSINNNSENSVNFVIIGDANENYVTVSDNTYGDTTVSWP